MPPRMLQALHQELCDHQSVWHQHPTVKLPCLDAVEPILDGILQINVLLKCRYVSIVIICAIWMYFHATFPMELQYSKR